MKKIQPFIFQCLWHPHLDIYEHHHSIDGAPWMPHGSTRHDTAPDHLHAIHDRILAKYEEHHVSDGENEVRGTPRITAIRITSNPHGFHAAHINIGWFMADGTPLHGVQEVFYLEGDEHDAHAAHRDHHHTLIPVSLRQG